MAKIQKATRLPKDQADQVEEYAEQQEISEADALRRLIRTGLDVEGFTDDGTSTRTHGQLPVSNRLLAILLTLDIGLTASLVL